MDNGNKLQRQYAGEEDIESIRRRGGNLGELFATVVDDIGVFVPSHGVSKPP